MSVFSERLRKLRNEKSITRDQLAAATGISRESISNYELGRRSPTGKALALFEQYFKVSGTYLFGLADAQTEE